MVVRKSRIILLLPLVAALFLQPACSAGQRAEPRSDIDAYEVGNEVFDTKILIASGDSDFKVGVAGRIGELLQDKPVYVKFIATDRLENEDISKYSAIIVMAKCVTWEPDPFTKSFLKKNSELSNLVMLFTSGDGDWKPEMEGMKFDAVTSASVLANVDSVADEILEKLYAILDRKA